MIRHKKLLIAFSFANLLFLFTLIINIIPPKKAIENNPFRSQNGKTMICAHRGGGIQNPENTMKAYRACVEEFDVAILETDLWLTKDNMLVLNHDGQLNRTSDAEIVLNTTEKLKISDFTLLELRQFNFGYNFQKNDEYPYRYIDATMNPLLKAIAVQEAEVGIVEFEYFLNQFYEKYPDLLFIVEIKNSGELGYLAADLINDLLTNKFPKYKNRIVIGTFNDEVEAYLKNQYPTLLRGASTKIATEFIVTQLIGANLFSNNNFACLQIPTEQKGLDLTLKTYINRAHRRNIAVQYWTINSKKEMLKLAKLGADAIMTDDPLLLKMTLNELYN